MVNCKQNGRDRLEMLHVSFRIHDNLKNMSSSWLSYCFGQDVLQGYGPLV